MEYRVVSSDRGIIDQCMMLQASTCIWKFMGNEQREHGIHLLFT